METQLYILYVGLALAAVIDIASSKIPNWLTFALLAVGLAASATVGPGIGVALLGAGVAFAVHFALWQLQLEGAGDAKLMMAVGAFVGWQTMLEATLWRYMLMFPYAIITITVLRRWSNFKAALAWTWGKIRGRDVGERPEPKYMPFGPLLAAAVPIAIHTAYLEFF